ncbi:AraC family transcriptional regulator [Wenyingzhuangia sp. chi5]|uniref:AraC family transcriptional regulator n=1 Tax=Wenyingzhuangia gilva TaxID=3057677 RepID=A0ABT8VPR6_9FLAO|nr:AraC family transcriptional regulator [Wenyingzhuangia sp. chi5]MDO3693946.1 AraC family transcriptional regulator [Wenyingzhuangia sp. chi5]
MKPKYLDRTPAHSCFNVQTNKENHFLKVWHFHKELELDFISSSSGTLFAGDFIGKFSEGNLVLLGKNLPHMWVNSEEYFVEGNDLFAEASVVHFTEEFLGEEFLKQPEMVEIKNLFVKARRGIVFKGDTSLINKRIQSLNKYAGFNRVIELLKILNLLAKWEAYSLLSSQDFVQSFSDNKLKKLEVVYEYIYNHFNTDISLEKVAEVACMNPSAFSRYFKKAHGKNFIKYVNELRVNYACKLILDNKYAIIDVCFECGFNNLSNFNRQFKIITGSAPSNYLKEQKR